MTRVLWLRIGLTVSAIAIFGLGIRADDERARIVGIVLLVAALALRFVDRRPPGARRDR